MKRSRNMKTSRYLILIIFVLVLVVPVARFYTIDPDINACMIEYIDSFDDSNGNGFIYKIDGVNHIEANNSIFNQYITEHKVGYSQGCIMASGDLFTDFNNSVYCSETYIAKKAINHYTDEPEMSLLERFKLFKSLKIKFFDVAKSDLLLAEDILLENYTSGIDDVLFSLKFIYEESTELLEEI